MGAVCILVYCRFVEQIDDCLAVTRIDVATGIEVLLVRRDCLVVEGCCIDRALLGASEMRRLLAVVETDAI